ncbi:hypothetical protein B0H11DRAFT_2228322 [Mycena galericulata]|nr:hypothetical protein B0H11DRAFT_2228322 [Mycena galericulata]
MYLLTAPKWPPYLSSLSSLLDYLRTCEPVALYRAKFKEDFISPPPPYAPPEPSVFATPDVNAPFAAMLFGREYKYGHCTFAIDGGPVDTTISHEIFGMQLSTLAAPVAQGDDDDFDAGIYMRVETWSDTDRSTRTGGTSIIIHLADAEGQRCRVYTPVESAFLSGDGDFELDFDVPMHTAQYKFGVGDWIVALVTLHCRKSYVNGTRDYEILARHLRVLPAASFHLREDRPTPSFSPPRMPSLPPTRYSGSHNKHASGSCSSELVPLNQGLHASTIPKRQSHKIKSDISPIASRNNTAMKRAHSPDSVGEEVFLIETPRSRHRVKVEVPSTGPVASGSNIALKRMHSPDSVEDTPTRASSGGVRATPRRQKKTRKYVHGRPRTTVSFFLLLSWV